MFDYNIAFPQYGTDTITKLLTSINEMNLNNSRKFLTELVLADKMIILNSEMTTVIREDHHDVYLRQLFILMEALDVAHGKENWSMNINYKKVSGKYKFYIHPILRYKHFTITNSKDHKREIRDMFVSLQIVSTNYGDPERFKIYFDNPYGFKTTYSVDEYNAGYVHSHLTSLDPEDEEGIFGQRAFCTGSGEINSALDEVRRSFSRSNIINFVLACKTMIEWESLEGTPYFNMSNITSNSNVQRPITITSNMSSMLRQISSKMAEYRYDFMFLNNSYTIRVDKKLDDYVKTAFHETGLFNLVVKKDRTSGKYICFNPNSREDGDIRHYQNFDEYIYFRGNKMGLKIKRTARIEPDNINEFFTHPNFLDYVKQRVEEQLHIKISRHQAIERNSNSEVEYGNNASDSISV